MITIIHQIYYIQSIYVGRTIHQLYTDVSVPLVDVMVKDVPLLIALILTYPGFVSVVAVKKI